jgi:hypothetical protein
MSSYSQFGGITGMIFILGLHMTKTPLKGYNGLIFVLVFMFPLILGTILDDRIKWRALRQDVKEICSNQPIDPETVKIN